MIFEANILILGEVKSNNTNSRMSLRIPKYSQFYILIKKGLLIYYEENNQITTTKTNLGYISAS